MTRLCRIIYSSNLSEMIGMCGVFGIVGPSGGKVQVLNNVLEALKNLEYRGYDSAGVAWMEDGSIQIQKQLGAVDELRSLRESWPATHIAMGHTRWATHGKPSTLNAHPMQGERFALVHNGIIDHSDQYKTACEERGVVFSSDTDTEVLLMMLEQAGIDNSSHVESWMPEFLASFHGQWSIVWMDNTNPDVLYAYCKGRPLFVSRGQDCSMIGSDVMSLAEYSGECAYVGKDAWVKLTSDGIYRYVDQSWVDVEFQAHGCKVEKQSRGKFDSYMMKEMHEQSHNIERQFLVYEDSPWMLNPWIKALTDAGEIVIVACGSSFYAGLVAKYAIERQLKKRVVLDIASEFNYRSPVLSPGSVVIAISQSGETADTLAAVLLAKSRGIKVAVLCNVPSSMMALEADLLLPLLAGAEIGVASTKAFTAQVFALLYLSQKVAHGSVDFSDVEALMQVIDHQMDRKDEIQSLAKQLSSYRHVMYVARDILTPIASEGALKLKELAYIHAESYAAGELKHGPIALIDESHPSIALVDPENRERMYANIQEIRARSGKVFVLEVGGDGSADFAWKASVPLWLQPLSFVLPLQLLSYYAAKSLDKNVDKPRNLAKCVTVE